MGETSGAGGATQGAELVKGCFLGLFWLADKLGAAAKTGHSVLLWGALLPPVTDGPTAWCYHDVAPTFHDDDDDNHPTLWNIPWFEPCSTGGYASVARQSPYPLNYIWGGAGSALLAAVGCLDTPLGRLLSAASHSSHTSHTHAYRQRSRGRRGCLYEPAVWPWLHHAAA
jgi:hypothetical protein